MNPDGTPNPAGKAMRTWAKQFILPVVVECGGIFEESKISKPDFDKWLNDYIKK